MRSIEEIKSELAAAVAAEEAARKAARESVKPVWKFTVEPTADRYDKVYDDSCQLYKVTGTVLNAEAIEAVGGNVSGQGSMAYLFNSLSGKIVMSVGGGTVWIGSAWGNDNDSADIAMNELNTYLAAHPDGGDITEIVTAHQARVRAESDARKAARIAKTAELNAKYPDKA